MANRALNASKSSTVYMTYAFAENLNGLRQPGLTGKRYRGLY